MVLFIITKETHRVVKSVTRHFLRLGWRVTKTELSQEPLLHVTKRDIVCLISCVDTDIQRFVPVSELIDRLDSFGGKWRRRSGEVIVFVVNRALNGLAEGALLSRGVSLFALADLDLLTDLELLYQDIPASLSENERLLVRGCKGLCIALSNAALKKRDFNEARRWLELNLDGVEGLLETHFKLVDLLIFEENYDAARAVAVRALSASPQNDSLLKRLRKIAVATSNMDALPELDVRISSALEARPALDSILGDPRLGAEAVTGGAEWAQRKHLKASFFQRLLKRACRPTQH